MEQILLFVVQLQFSYHSSTIAVSATKMIFLEIGGAIVAISIILHIIGVHCEVTPSSDGSVDDSNENSVTKRLQHLRTVKIQMAIQIMLGIYNNLILTNSVDLFRMNSLNFMDIWPRSIT